jgi:hypothetical protein
MALFDKDTKEQILKVLKHMKSEESSLKEMQQKVLDDFGTILSLKTISVYVSEANKDEWLAVVF